MIGQTISHYRILEKIGEGGMGEVYLAEDTELRRKVAMKFLPAGYATDRDVLARFKREARAAAALNHPHIITIHQVGAHEGRPYIVMAHVEGHPLSAAIAAGPLALDKVLDIAIQIADGLSKAHQAGVIHRDIKPDNILIDRDGSAKILDFGLAKLHGVTKLTSEASTLGTVYYMSPEQARSADVDQRSDIFSFGAVLYEMLAGRVPFRGDHAAAVMYAITSEEPPPLARFNTQVSPELERIVAKALAKDPGERYQTVADLLADLHRERRRSDAAQPAASPSAAVPRRRAMKVIVPTSIVFAAVLALLILKPFRLQIGSDQPVVAAENTLAVMYFDNLVDPGDEKRLGEIITNLLITDLSESRGVNVLSSQRLYDLLKLEGKEGVRSLDRATSTGVAQRAGAKWMLLGSILQVEPAIVVTSQLVEVTNGAVASSQRVTGTQGESVFNVADRLSHEIQSDMSIPTPPAHKPVLTNYTRSEEAYRYYLEGVSYNQKYYRAEAKERYLKALAYDSTFAMPYYALAVPPAHTTQSEKIAYIEKALRFSDGLAESDRMRIEGTYAYLHGDREEAVDRFRRIVELYPEDKETYFTLANILMSDRGELQAAIDYLRRAIEIDPLYPSGYNLLAYAYDRAGDLDRSIWAIDKYIEIAPDEANPYDTRGDLYANNGKIGEAISSYKSALERKPDYYVSVSKLGHMYRALRDYATAATHYRQLLDGGPRSRSLGRLYLACNSLYQGKLKQGFEQLEQGLAADRIDGFRGAGYNEKLVTQAQVYELWGDWPAALALCQQLSRYGESSAMGWDEVLCEMLAKSGDITAAEEGVAALRKAAEQGMSRPAAGYRYALGWIAYAKGDYDDAAGQFSAALGREEAIWNRFPLARSYLMAGRLDEAVAAFDEMRNRFNWSWGIDPIDAATMHYYAGIACERSGRNAQAVERYEEFLTIWKDADPGLEIVADAKRRLERLRRGS